MNRNVARIAVALVPLVLFGGCPPAPPTPGSPVPPDSASVGLLMVADGLVAPVALLEPPDDSGRLFVVDQIGLISIIAADAISGRKPAPFLDLRDRIVPLQPFFDERGLLGLAFHPDYAISGRFFVFYSAPPSPETPAGFVSESRIAEFRVSDDPNLADPASERILLRIAKPQSNHNGGQLAFGPDGFLYIGVGDGGAANDVGFGHTPGVGNAQDKTTLLGKILCIDVDAGDPYAVPPDNPFVNQAGARPEIYAFGLRNPWRFSFDTDETGRIRLFVADVGQSRREEVSIVISGGNYAWNLREGTLCFDSRNPGTLPDSCGQTGAGGEPLIDPILDYPHRDEPGRPAGTSVIGGFVYRGAAIPALQGQYVFGDLSASFSLADGSLFVASESEAGLWTQAPLGVADRVNGRIGHFIFGFGRDGSGELYVLTADNTGRIGATGVVYKIVPS